MLDILKNDAKCGDRIKIYLISGEIIEGTLTEFNDTNILIDDSDIQKRIFPVMIGGWEIVKQDTKEKTTDDITPSLPSSMEREDVVSIFDSLYKELEIDLNSNIITNASIIKIHNEGVEVLLDNGQSILCHKGYMVGFSRANCATGRRVYCSVYSGKNMCYRSIIEMTYSELHSRFVKALYNTPIPRLPIIESILTYLKNTLNSKNAKNILFKIRASVKELSGTDKLDVWQQIELFKNKKQYDSALEIVNKSIESCIDNKQKAALLLKKAQLYSTMDNNKELLSSYNEFIIYCESIEYPETELSHYYIEYAKLLRLAERVAESEVYVNKAMQLNPSNAEVKKMHNLYTAFKYGNSVEGEKTPLEASLLDSFTFNIKKNAEFDIDNHNFSNPVIKSLNGRVTDEIAHRLLDEANISGSMLDYLEAAKALKQLSIGSYDSQEYEDAVANYLVLKSRSLYGSFKKIIVDSVSIEDYSIEELTLLKDSAIGYYLETIENTNGDNESFVFSLLEECLKMELSLESIKIDKDKQKAEKIFSTFVLNSSIFQEDEEFVVSILQKICFYSVRCVTLWNCILMNSQFIANINAHIVAHPSVASTLIKSENTTKSIKIDIYSPLFFNKLVSWEYNWVSLYYKRFNKIFNSTFDVFSLKSLTQKCNNLLKQKFTRCLCDSDKKNIKDINRFLAIISIYQNRDTAQRREILENSIKVLSEILNWNSSNNTILGRQFITPLLNSWKASLQILSNKQEDKKDCFLSVSFDPPHFASNSEGKYFTIILSNNSAQVAEGYRLAIWKRGDRSTAIIKSGEIDILQTTHFSLKFNIPVEKWGDIEVYELEYAVGSKYLNNWSKDLLGGITISRNRSVEFTKQQIKWRDQGKVSTELFKGRDEIVKMLKNHYASIERYYSYILYGLSRTGKSCILEFLKESISNSVITKGNSKFYICPLLLDLGAIYGVSKSYESFWEKLLKKLYKDANKFILEHNITSPVEYSTDFDRFISDMYNVNIHPLFMFDEFSYMKSIIDDGYMNSAFLQYMRKLAADDDMASFIFAGTYDIKGLIHDSKYNISGAFNYLKEPEKPIFEISESAAEELINIMDDKLLFTKSAIKEIHRLTGDVPYWIQKICLNCGYYAVENNRSDIGIDELEQVVKRLTGEIFDVSDSSSIGTMSSTIFDMTQTLPTDPVEVKLILTTVAYLIKKDKSHIGVTHERMKELWSEYDFDYSKLNISDAIKLLLERKTFSHEEKDQHHYYRFSLELFRRWWLQNHYDIGLELTTFAKKYR